MLQKHIAYIIILWLLVEVDCQTERHDHTATFINNKLYILGGRIGNSIDIPKEFSYIDFSSTLDTHINPLKDLSSNSIPPPHEGAASVKGGQNDNILFIYGGRSDEPSSLVYTFDSQSNLWNTPTITGSNPDKKYGLTGVVNNGKMYLWGGMANKNYVNDMLILDTINLSWSVGSSTGSPTPRINYAATSLLDNKIIYLGGNNNFFDRLPLNEVYIYDTVGDNWSTKVTSGQIPSSRHGFSAVLGLDGQRVIIFGGLVDDDDSLYELNLIDFKWSIPKTSGEIPGTRYFHKANVIGKYMVISLGAHNRQSTKKNSNDVLLLDISNKEEYIWTTNFKPSTTIHNPSHGLPISVIMGIVSAIVAVVCISGLLCYRRYRRRHSNSPKAQEEGQTDSKTPLTTRAIPDQTPGSQVREDPVDPGEQEPKEDIPEDRPSSPCMLTKRDKICLS